MQAETPPPPGEPRVVTVPLSTPEMNCLALALDGNSRCVAWAEIPKREDWKPIIFSLECILTKRFPERAL